MRRQVPVDPRSNRICLRSGEWQEDMISLRLSQGVTALKRADQNGFTMTRITIPIMSTVGNSFIQR